MDTLVVVFNALRFWFLITVLSIVFGIASVLARCFDASGDKSNRVNSCWSRLMCTLNGIKVEVIGMENIDPGQAQILVANHQSYYDIFVLDGFLPVQIRWVTKDSIFLIPFVGWAMRASGYIGVRREDKKMAYQSFMETVGKLKAGKSVVIFPEGTRSMDGKIGPFKKGSLLLAIRSGAPMVPVTIVGTRQVMRKGRWFIHPGPIRVIISPPVTIDKSENKNHQQILGSIRETICQNYEENFTAQDQAGINS